MLRLEEPASTTGTISHSHCGVVMKQGSCNFCYMFVVIFAGKFVGICLY